MIKISIDREWEFMQGEPSKIPGMPKQTKIVNLPHDFMIESEVKPDSVNGSNTGFYDGATGTYTKYIEVLEEWADKHVLVEFDGVFCDASVILNGHIMGRHHCGYTPFRTELSGCLNAGKKNRLAVVVSNDAQPNSRWYSGGGIYRHVNLLVAPQVHIAPDGIYARTDHIVGDDAFVVVETTVENHTSQDQDLWVNVALTREEAAAHGNNVLAGTEDTAGADASVREAAASGGSARAVWEGMAHGNKALAGTEDTAGADASVRESAASGGSARAVWEGGTATGAEGPAGASSVREAAAGAPSACAATGAIKVHIPAHDSAVARTMICVENAAIWDIDDPNLYTVTAQLVSARPTDQAEETEILDETKTLFGIRTISVDAKNGFRLNGRSLKLMGGCIHHDNGILGAASFYESEYRKVKLHKDNGYNALRFAHNPASAEMLEACDRLGILVMDEAFDTWNMPKNRHDYCRHFEAEWQQEMKSFLLRDRNHPCVAFWSIGNELPEQGGLSDGFQTSAKLAACVRSLDSTRPVTGALCSFFNGLNDEDTGKFWQSLMEEAQLNGGALNNLDGKFGREIWNDYTESFCGPGTWWATII